MMYGQMTAGSWIYIGSQGIVQGTYETFGAVARRHFGGTLAGRFVLTAGLGGMGGAQPLAATMKGAAMLVRRSRRGAHREAARDAATATARRTTSTKRSRWIDEARARGDGALGRARRQRGRRAPGARAARRHARRAHRSDERARHAERLRPRRACRSPRRPTLRRERPDAVRRARDGVRSSSTCARCSSCSSAARSRSTTATTSARSRSTPASRDAFDIPGFVPEYIRPLFCEGKGPFRWVALSGDPADICAHRRARARALSRTTRICAAGSRSRASGCSSRDCRRASAGWVRASARDSASRSTTSSRAASSPRRS